MMESRDLEIQDLKLNALLEITQAINNNLPEESLYKIYRFMLLADLKIQKIALYVLDEDWRCKVNFGTNHSLEGESLPDQYQNLDKPKKLDTDEKVYCEFNEVLPVSHKQRLLAVVFVGGTEGPFVDTTFLQALTNIIIVAIENKKLARKQIEQEAYRRELEIAKQVQNYLIPNSLPNTQNLQLEASYIPHQDVGGDYYDYIPLGEHKFVVCVADVSGKGVPAALLMSNFQASLRTLVRNSATLEHIVRELNYQINLSGNGENFITFFIAFFDDEKRELEYANCGHNPSIFLEKGKPLRLLEEGTTILGMFHPLPFIEMGKIDIENDFFLFCYTDGVTEVFNDQDEEYGQDRLVALVENNPDIAPAKLHSLIFQETDKFRGQRGYHDDITMLSCKVKLK